jgi:hypothetical protein
MARRVLIGTLAGVLLTAVSAAASVPNLRSVSSQRRHVVAVFVLNDLTPGQIVVANKAARTPTGAFLAANVRLRETMAPTYRNGAYHWRTKHVLRPGRYFVEISARPITTDCLPVKTCPVLWSNVRRLIVPRPRR